MWQPSFEPPPPLFRSRYLKGAIHSFIMEYCRRRGFLDRKEIVIMLYCKNWKIISDKTMIVLNMKFKNKIRNQYTIFSYISFIHVIILLSLYLDFNFFNFSHPLKCTLENNINFKQSALKLFLRSSHRWQHYSSE